MQGDYDDASQRYDQVLDIATTLGNRWLQASSLSGLADIARMQGEYDEHASAKPSARHRHHLGDRTLQASSLRRLADVARGQGDYDEAHRLYDQALDITTTLGNGTLQAHSLLGLANIALMQGDYDDAHRRYDQTLDIATTLGNRTRQADSLHGLADVAAMRGDYDDARRHYDQALDIATPLRTAPAKPTASAASPTSPAIRATMTTHADVRPSARDRHYPRRPHRKAGSLRAPRSP